MLDYFLLPHMNRFKRKDFHDCFLRTAIRLDNLTEFCVEVKKLWTQRVSVEATCLL